MFYKGDILYVDFGNRVGSEQEGIRPCIIVSNNVGNRHSNTITVCPITSVQKKFLPTHIEIYLDKKSTILCEQIVTIDKQRILRKVKSSNKYILNRIDKALKITLGL